MTMILEIRDFVSDAAYANFGEQVAGGRKRMFEWLSDVVNYDTGKRQANQVLPQPIRHWWINWQFLDEAARNKLVELFNRARGRTTTFLYECIWDYACTYTDWSYTAAGGETTTQLQKTYYKGETEEWTENKTKIQASGVYAPTIKIDGVAKTEGTHFTLDDDTGIIDWTGGSAPNGALSVGEVVTADYQFYYEVAFSEDTYEDMNHRPDYFKPGGELHLIEVL